VNNNSQLIRDLMRFSFCQFEHVNGALASDEQKAAIGRNYELHKEEVAAGASDWSNGNPYDIADWAAVLTPVEFGAWQDIRSHGLPLWPRLPVGDLAISFGNPVGKIALLCGDDVDASLRVDHWLTQSGWRVFRASAEQCTRVMESPAGVRERTGEISEEYRVHYLTETLEGTIQDLRHAFIAAGAGL
jgi:hypothetical protein